MKRMLLLLVVALLATVPAQAQFVASNAGPLASSGGVGDAGNGEFTANYGGATTIFNRLAFTGTLTEVIPATFESEASWFISNQTILSDGTFFPSSNSNTFTGPITVSRAVDAVAWIGNGHSFRFESFETFDDGAGADANWTDVSFTFSGTFAPTSLGSFLEGTNFTFDTIPSNFDTMLALYTASGTVIDTDDDGGGAGTSLLTLGALPAGDYVLIAGGFFSSFSDGIALAGEADGNLGVRLNGNSFFSGALGAFEFETFSFSVSPIPEPTTLILGAVGMGGAFLGYRRRLRVRRKSR